MLPCHRFLFILLGPPKVKTYHEVGRAMATLLTDEVSLAQHPWVGWAWNGHTRIPLQAVVEGRGWGELVASLARDKTKARVGLQDGGHLLC